MASKARSEWEKRIECVMDLCTSLEFSVLSHLDIRRAYVNVGTVLVGSADCGKQLILLSLNVYPWTTKKNRHYYCEFASAHEADAALIGSNLPSELRVWSRKGVVTSAAKYDPQHVRRFKELAAAAATDASKRYSPYERRATRAMASSPTRDISDPSSSKSKRGVPAADNPRDDPGQAPEEGEIIMSDTIARPNITIPFLGEAVRLPLNHAATPSAISALLSLSGSERPFPHIPSPPSSASYSQTAQEMISQLSDLQRTLPASGAQRATVSNQYRIHPKFDFRSHITSGRFLKPELKASGLDAKSFEPTPLQTYFADIYGTLQTDLDASRRRIGQQDFELERMKLLCQRREDELAEERAARRDAEALAVELRRQLERSDAYAREKLQEVERCNSLLGTSRGELERLKGVVSQIQAVCDVSLDPMASRPSSSTYPSS